MINAAKQSGPELAADKNQIASALTRLAMMSMKCPQLPLKEL
jgi:hypothetical protein